MHTREKKAFRRICLQMLISILVPIICVPAMCYALEPPPITSTSDFFVENSQGIPPIPDNWHLTVDGAVETPLSLTLDDLMNYPATTLMATLECLSLSTELIGNATWTGVPLHTIIEDATPRGDATSFVIHALDGYAMQGRSLELVLQRDDILLAYSMNGETLPLEQGYPLRLVLPGSYGYVWLQWISRIEIVTTPPQYNDLNPFPMHTKMFQPHHGDTLALAPLTISGMAFVGEGREITTVEISTDGGATWSAAQLLNYFVPNAWKHWEFNWIIPQAGEYQIFARAYDDSGNVQNALGFLSGYASTGITVNVLADTCEGNFDCDGDQDGSDAAKFKLDFGRGIGGERQCTNELPCNGDFTCDNDVDGSDAALFKSDFGRGIGGKNTCPSCVIEPWCVYQ